MIQAPPLELTTEQYKTLANELRVKLVNAQYDLKSANASVVLMLAGNDLAGCEEFIDVLQEWVDVRYVDTRAFRWPNEAESLRPPLWRYWNSMPSQGRLAVFYGAWIMNLVLERSAGTITKKEFTTRLTRLNSLENLLTDDGSVVVKIWLHASEKDQKKRLSKAKKQPDSELYVGQFAKHIYNIYKKSLPVVAQLDEVLRGVISWQWVDGSSSQTRNITIAQRLLAGIESAVANTTNNRGKAIAFDSTEKNYLSKVDLTATYRYEDYKQRLTLGQLRLKKLFLKAHKHYITPVIALEGWDAAGKGGVIRRITRAISAWRYRVVPIAAPSQEELEHHYLWRFWREIPSAGEAVIFDRSWYGRVLVERVEKYATKREWVRAYDEINEFEAQLDDAHCCVMKFWLHIDSDEQLARFKLRETTHYKKYKITEDDYRNRGKWNDYELAVNDMVAYTSTDLAPWHLIPANNKRYARVVVIETLCDQLEKFIAARKNKRTDISKYKYHHL